jgi:hypothetical protein
MVMGPVGLGTRNHSADEGQQSVRQPLKRYSINHNEELHNLCSSPNIMMMNSRRILWTAHAVHMRVEKSANSVLVGKPEGWRPFGRSGRTWENNIKVDP